MKPSELYKLPHAEEDFDLYTIKRFMSIETGNIEDGANERIKIRYYVNENFDSERGFKFMSVWFRVDEDCWAPFMICGDAGRGGSDDEQCYITDVEIYQAAELYAKSIAGVEDWCHERAVKSDEDIPELGNFYGLKFNEMYRTDPTTKYKVGDIVIARAKENHLKFLGNDTVLTRVKIDLVNPHSTHSTYRGYQLDRRWNGKGDFTASPVFAHNEGQFGWKGNDKDIVRLATDEDNKREGYPEA